jgi:uncharacterized BrkB/YihY/UPF0761 family membrane protein
MAEPSDIAEVIKAVQDDITTIVRGEVALVADEIKGEAAKAGIIAGLFGGAGYVAISAVAVLFSAFGFAWSIGYQAWFGLGVLPALFWGFLTMGVLMLLIAGLLGLLGSRAPKPGAPTRSIEDAKEQVAFVKDTIAQASADAAAQPLLPPRTKQPELD